MPEIIRFPHNDLSPEEIDVKARNVRGACLAFLRIIPNQLPQENPWRRIAAFYPFNRSGAPNSAQRPSPRTVLNWSGE